jgi:hypothetical protein
MKDFVFYDSLTYQAYVDRVMEDLDHPQFGPSSSRDLEDLPGWEPASSASSTTPTPSGVDGAVGQLHCAQSGSAMPAWPMPVSQQSIGRQL